MKTVSDAQARISDLDTRLKNALRECRLRMVMSAASIQDAVKEPGANFEDQVSSLTAAKAQATELRQAQNEMCRARELVREVVVDEVTAGKLLELLNDADRAVHQATNYPAGAISSR